MLDYTGSWLLPVVSLRITENTHLQIKRYAFHSHCSHYASLPAFGRKSVCDCHRIAKCLHADLSVCQTV